MKRIFLLLAACILFAGNSVYAQPMKWRLAAPNILSPGAIGGDGLVVYGAIAAKGRTVIAGWANVVLSSDEGRTWTTLSAPVQSPDYVLGIDIFDDNTFAIVTNESGAFYSQDRGVTWNKIRDVFPAVHAIKFAGAPDRFAIILSNNEFIITQTGGLAISGFVPGLTVLTDVQIAADNSIRFMGFVNDILGPRAVFNTTTDFGFSWSPIQTIQESDNFTFITDPRDANRMVIINEGFAFSTIGRAQILLTTDNGASWSVSFSQRILNDKDYILSGNSGKGCQDYFAGTRASGVLRSQDKGVTWQSIGGPPSAFDSRLMTAADDSLVYAVDTLGSIWVTDTKGRSSQPIITGDLQLRATEFPPCDTSAEIFIDLAQNICTSTNITSLTIVGANASDYTITKLPSSPLTLPDSIGVGFTPGATGDIDATLVMTFSDGTRYTIDLGTKVKSPPTLSFANLEFTNITTDTIGGDAVLHILSTGTGISADAEFTIHYDTAYLIYRGVFDAAGRDLTISHPTPTSARIRMNNLSDSSLFALFSFFPVDSACTKVYIDSLTEAPGKTKCLTLIPSPVEALICFDPAGVCGRQALSKFVKNGVFPSLFVKPNPSSGNVTISSDRDIHYAVIDIIDAYGAIQKSISIDKLTREGYMLSSAHLPSGAYEARVTSEGYSSTIRFVIIK